jgi:hypothetical protein
MVALPGQGASRAADMLLMAGESEVEHGAQGRVDGGDLIVREVGDNAAESLG